MENFETKTDWWEDKLIFLIIYIYISILIIVDFYNNI